MRSIFSICSGNYRRFVRNTVTDAEAVSSMMENTQPGCPSARDVMVIGDIYMTSPLPGVRASDDNTPTYA